MTALTNIDLYKSDHRSQSPEGTELVFTNWTPRGCRMEGVKHITFFGLQYYLKRYLIEEWNRTFFNRDIDEVVEQYQADIAEAGITITVEHITALHKLGYLPVCIQALPEGVNVPIGVPMFVAYNTHKDFSWLPLYLETSLSCTLWGMCNSATIAGEYRKIIEAHVEETGGSYEAIDWQCHDFGMRGMFGLEAAKMSGAAHLLHFTGTDTLPAIGFLKEYYAAEGLIGGSVPATEHSVMCLGTQEAEIDTFRRLITEVYPSGVVSIVSDTWDYWKVLTDMLPKLKEFIMAREGGPVVIRPDSGDPVKILCGDPQAIEGSPEYKGSFELAWDLFGGTTTEKGFKVLDPHISFIYGDSITMDRCREITSRLKQKGFCFTGVLGIGSYTYQFNTRDTCGFAMKATYGEVNGEPREIFKDPKTDSGEKKSAKGLLAVYKMQGRYMLKQQATWENVRDCALRTVFLDGDLQNELTLAEVRANAKASKVIA